MFFDRPRQYTIHTYTHLESQFWDFFQLVVTRREARERRKKKWKYVVGMYVFIFWDVVTDAQHKYIYDLFLVKQ
jgi:hypothetical protein